MLLSPRGVTCLNNFARTRPRALGISFGVCLARIVTRATVKNGDAETRYTGVSNLRARNAQKTRIRPDDARGACCCRRLRARVGVCFVREDGFREKRWRSWQRSDDSVCESKNFEGCVSLGSKFCLKIWLLVRGGLNEEVV